MSSVLRLSPQALKNVRSSEFEKTFKFLVGDKSHQCHWFVAELLSPVISQLRQSDSSVDSYVVQTPNCSSIFDRFLSIGYGEEVEVTDSTRALLLSLCTELGNEDLCRHIVQDAKLTPENVLSRLEMKRLCGWDVSAEVEFAASHLSEISREHIETLDTADFSNIIAGGSVSIESEDWLYEVVSSFVGRRAEDFWLFESVRFEYLSVESISSFVDLSEDHLASVNLAIWRGICARLAQSRCRPGVSDRVISRGDGRVAVEIPMKEERSLEGIISYLTKKHGGNVHEKGIVTITSKSLYSAAYALRKVADLATTSRVPHNEPRFESKNEPGQWICWDFGEMWLLPTHHTIKSDWMKSWVVESSLNGESWVEIDRQTNHQVFKPKEPMWKTVSLPVSNPAECRFIRLTQTEEKHNGSHYLSLCAVEFFGTLFE
jgi:hypothetical protein